MVGRQTLESRDPGFDPHTVRQVVSLSKTQQLPRVLVIPRKLFFYPDLTDKLLTGTSNLNSNKQSLLVCNCLSKHDVLICFDFKEHYQIIL